MSDGASYGQDEEAKIAQAATYNRNENDFRDQAAQFDMGRQYYADALNTLGGGTGNLTSETEDLKTTFLPSQGFGEQAIDVERALDANILWGQTQAALDRMNQERYTELDIERAGAVGAETRLGQKVGGQEERAIRAEQGAQDRAKLRVEGQENRGIAAETGQQERAGMRVLGQEDRARTAEEGSQDRATQRVLGQEDRGRIAEEGSQTRASRRVEGQEVRETDLQREQFRRYKEARDYDQAQSLYRA